MENNFIVEMKLLDGTTFKFDMNELNLNIYQKGNKESVKVLEITGRHHVTDPGGHQLNLSTKYVGGPNYSSMSSLNSLVVHSYKYGKGE